MNIKYGKSKRIMASESDGNYDKSFKAKGTTYYIEMLSGAGNYVAKWWDSSDNGLGYNNKGWVAIEGKNYRALNNISDVSSDNIIDLLSVVSDYDRKPGKPIQDRIKREVAKLLDFDAINSACGKKSVKASYDPDTAVGIFYESLDILNRFFKGTCVFKATVGSYNMPKCTSYYENDGVDFLRDLSSLIKDNSSQAIMEWIEQYESNPLYLAVINGTEDEYIQEHISGEDMNNIDPTVDLGFVDEWYDMFDHDCYLLGVEIADQICGYLSYFSDIVADADGSYDYEDDFYEVRLNYYGDNVTSSTKPKSSRRGVNASTKRSRSAKAVKASTYNSIELTFISPNLETGRLVVDKAREIGGFGSTWNEHSWVYIDVPSDQSVDNVDDLIQYAQSVGVYLNRPSAKLLDAWADSKAQTVLRGCTEKSVKASAIMSAADISNLTIYVPSYCYVDVMVDSYEQGEGEQVNSWTFQVADGFRTAQDLIDDIAESSGIFSNDINDYVVLDSSLQTDATVNVDNMIPTDAEIEAWKRGELELYVAHLWVNLQVGSATHDITDEEAEAFGLSIY